MSREPLIILSSSSWPLTLLLVTISSIRLNSPFFCELLSLALLSFFRTMSFFLLLAMSSMIRSHLDSSSTSCSGLSAISLTKTTAILARGQQIRNNRIDGGEGSECSAANGAHGGQARDLPFLRQ